MSRRRNHAPPESLAECFVDAHSDYRAAKASRYRRRRTGVSPMGSGADYHYRNESDYLRLLEEARDFDRNDVIVGQTINRACDNIVQGGFALDVDTGDPKLDDDLEARWQAESSDPQLFDLEGERCFHDQERLAWRHTLVDGDVFCLPTEDGPLQMVEAHRCRTPRGTKRNVVHGVLLNAATRRREQFWFTREDVDPSRPVKLVGEIETYDAYDDEGQRQVFQVYDPKRFSQTRGVTALAPIFDACGMFEDINFAKLVQQQVVSCFALFREQAIAAGGGLPIADVPYGEQTTQALASGGTRRLEGIAPGMEITGRPGEKLNGFSPNVPNAEFFQHVRLIVQLIGINLGLPLVLVLLDGSETNFSGWRGAVDEARKGFRRNQRVFSERFHTPIYTHRVRRWAAEDAALMAAMQRLGPRYFKHKWNPPRWPYIEPLKDASADLLRLRNGLSSPRRVHAEHGDNFYEIVDELLTDNVHAIRNAKTRAAEINKEFDDGQPVHWREVISLPTPDGVTVSVTADDGQQDQPPTKKPAQ
jgi:capsid protein